MSLIALAPQILSAADPAPNAAQIFDRQLTGTEKEFVSLVEAMPANQFNFAPKNGAFQGVRTFAQQAKHVSFILNELSSALLGEKNPSTSGANENGPDNLTSRDDIIKYVKDAFAYAHRAVRTLNNSNLLELTTDPFDSKAKRTRIDSVSTMFWHTNDHYGQMVEYLRMNDVIPPASR